MKKNPYTPEQVEKEVARFNKATNQEFIKWLENETYRDCGQRLERALRTVTTVEPRISPEILPVLF